MASKTSFYNTSGVTNEQSNAIDASVDNAEASAVASENSANSASTSASTATTKASEASTSASTATTKASEASTSASTATTKASEASTSAATATTKATESVTSATASANSATSASTSASTATTKASEASSSASTALSHKNDAQTAKTAAETAETNAETAETNAASSATAASTSASSASTSATTATAKANEAATSASTATTKANEATTSASNANTAASTATTKASEASTSANNAASSATAASASKDAALAALDNFDDRYLGVKSSNPTVDNDGNALVAGSLYFNSTDDTMKVYEGSAWVAAYASLSGAVLQTGSAMTGDLSFGDDDKAIFGTGSDLQIYHASAGGGHSYIKEIGTGNLRIQGADITLQDPDGNGFISMIDSGTGGTVYLKHSGSNVLSTTATGINVTGNATFADDGKATFGDGSDLEIYHDGSNSWIHDRGTGNLNIEGRNVFIVGANNDTNLAGFIDGAESRLYYNGSQKLATTSTGIDVTGNATFADNDKAIFGTGSDLQVWHNGANAFIDNTGVGNLYLRVQGDDKDVIIQSDNGSGGLTDYFRADGELGQAKMYHYGLQKLNTSSAGINVIGKVASDGLEVDLSSSGNVELTGAINSNSGLVVRDPTATAYGAHFSYDDANTVVSIGGQTNGTKNTAISIGRDSNDISFYEDTGTTAKLTWDSSAESLNFADDGKAIFGAGSDLEIYHQSSNGNSIIKESGGGTLTLQTNGAEVSLWDTTNGQHMGRFRNGAEVQLHHDGDTKFSTTSTGIDVTGTATMDGLVVSKASGDIATLEGTGTASDVQANLLFNPVYDVNARILSAREGSALASTLSFETGVDNTGNTVKRQHIASNGDISFYEDTGTTAKFFWDSSAESLGIGTSPTSALHVINSNDTGEGIATFEALSSKNGYVYINADANRRKSLVFQSAGVDKFSMGVGDSDELSESSFFIGNGKTGGNGAKLVIDSSGNVGIGTSSPARTLDVNGAMRLANGNGVEWGGVNEAIVGDTAGALIYKVGGAEVMRNTATGVDVTGNATFADNGKAIFGAGSDLEIYHNGTDSFIDEKGAGWLYIRGNNTVIGKYTGETYMKGIADGAVELYHDNVKKIETTASGVSVAGNIAVSGTVDGVDIATNIPSSLGTAGQVLTVNSGATAGEWADAGGGGGGAACTTLYNQTGSQTWTAPADCTVVIQAVGAGGSGGGISRDDTDNLEVAVSGGSGGGYSRKKVSLSSGDVLSFTVGAGGATESLSDNGVDHIGNAGGTTTVTATGISLTANGGSGGAGRRVNSGDLTFATQPTGGTASGGDLNVTGTAGCNVTSFTPPSTNDDIYLFSAGSFSSGFDGSITEPQTTYTNHNGTQTVATVYDDPSLVGQPLYINVGAKKGRMTGQINNTSTPYEATGDAGTLGCGGGATANISGDNDTGLRTVVTGAGGDGFVAITVIDIAV